MACSSRPRTQRAEHFTTEERDGQRACGGAHGVRPASDLVVARVAACEHHCVGLEHGKRVAEAIDASNGKTEQASASAGAQEFECANGGRVRIQLVSRGVSDE